MPPNMKLVAKGKSEPLVGLRDQGAYSLGLSEKYAAALARAGWTANEHAELQTVMAALDSQRAQQVEQRDQCRQSLAAEREALAEAKVFKRHLDLAVADLFARAAVDDSLVLIPTRDAFRLRGLGELGRSTAKHVSYLAEVRPHVQAVATQLAPYFDGRDAAKQLDEVRAALEAAQAKQEVTYASLPSDTEEVYEAKGRALLLIERLNRAGKIAFAGQAAVAAQFNKDILLRARKARKADPAVPVTPVEPAA